MHESQKSHAALQLDFSNLHFDVLLQLSFSESIDIGKYVENHGSEHLNTKSTDTCLQNQEIQN